MGFLWGGKEETLDPVEVNDFWKELDEIYDEFDESLLKDIQEWSEAEGLDGLQEFTLNSKSIAAMLKMSLSCDGRPDIAALTGFICGIRMGNEFRRRKNGS